MAVGNHTIDMKSLVYISGYRLKTLLNSRKETSKQSKSEHLNCLMVRICRY